MTAVALAVYAVLALTLVGNLLYLRRHRPGPGAANPAANVSVVIPARDEEENIGRALQSLAEQTYDSFDVTVYDDGSTDGTSAVVERYLHDERFRLMRGDGPPPGWVGKVHALYAATREVKGDVILFLDADTELLRPDSLERLVAVMEHAPEDVVLTALPHLRGGGLLLVSLIPYVILTMLPWFLVRRLPLRSLGALNGQCWMIRTSLYRETEPHLKCRAEVLEDVRIGQYLRSTGRVPTLVDLRDDLAVRMYVSLRDAWKGLRKNAYLMSGGGAIPFVLLIVFYTAVFIIAPVLDLRVLAALYATKLASDRIAGMPLGVSIFAPLSYILGLAVQLSSALAHWRGTVEWKGRAVGSV